MTHKKKPYSVIGPDGTVHDSIKAMCRHHGVKCATYAKRLKSGMSMTEALNPAKMNMSPCVGPDGRQYPSIKAMCAANGLNYGRTMDRTYTGNTLDKAIDPDFWNNRYQDHLGKWYPSLEKMLEAYHINISTYLHRRKIGWTLEKALTTPVSNGKGKPVTDFNGQPFMSVKDMCDFWSVSVHIVRRQLLLRKDRPPEDVLTDTIVSAWPGTKAGPYKIIQCVQWPWFLCQDPDQNELILHARKIRHFKNESKQPDQP